MAALASDEPLSIASTTAYSSGTFRRPTVTGEEYETGQAFGQNILSNFDEADGTF